MLTRNPNLHIRRFEFKYLIYDSELDKIRRAISNYVVVDPNAKNQSGKYQVTSVYFDDLDLSAYSEKLAGIKFRRKFRVRSYGEKVMDSDSVFLEIKKKDESIIFKDRSPLTYGHFKRILELGDYRLKDWCEDPQAASKFIGTMLANKLVPTVMTTYLREAYFDEKNLSFRITLDQNIAGKIVSEVTFDNKDAKDALKGYTILEAKFNRIMPAWFGTVVKSFGLEKISFSKYCRALEVCGKVQRSEMTTLAGLWT